MSSTIYQFHRPHSHVFIKLSPFFIFILTNHFPLLAHCRPTHTPHVLSISPLTHAVRTHMYALHSIRLSAIQLINSSTYHPSHLSLNTNSFPFSAHCSPTPDPSTHSHPHPTHPAGTHTCNLACIRYSVSPLITYSTYSPSSSSFSSFLTVPMTTCLTHVHMTQSDPASRYTIALATFHLAITSSHLFSITLQPLPPCLDRHRTPCS